MKENCCTQFHIFSSHSPQTEHYW